MTSRETHRVRCDRKRHALAVVYVDGGHVAVDVWGMVATSKGMDTVRGTLTTEDVGDCLSLTVGVTCGCGDNYDLDVAALARGEDARSFRIESETATGVSYDRRRPDVV